MTPQQERRPRDPNDGGWHLDKKVPISIILTIVLQCVAFTWFLGKQDARLTVIENSRAERIPSQEKRDDRQDQAMTEAVTALGARLDRIDNKLDRVNDKLSERK